MTPASGEASKGKRSAHHAVPRKPGLVLSGWACLVGAVVLGSLLPDLDHIFQGESRTWGHDYRLPLVVYAGLFLASLGRLAWVWYIGKKTSVQAILEALLVYRDR